MNVRTQFLGLANRLLDSDDWYNFYARMVAYSVGRKYIFDIRSRELMGWEIDDKYSIIIMTYSAPSDDSDPYANLELEKEKDAHCENLNLYLTIFIKDNDTKKYIVVHHEEMGEDDIEDVVASNIQDLGDVDELLEELGDNVEWRKI